MTPEFVALPQSPDGPKGHHKEHQRPQASICPTSSEVSAVQIAAGTWG